jgi:hypothetical protein
MEQLARRMWRNYPESSQDPRVKNDSYWALRMQGCPDSYARRAFRDQLPNIVERVASGDCGEYEVDELLIPAGFTWTEIEVAVRPDLTEKTIADLTPRAKEYTVWDVQVPGFGLRVFPSGRMSYVVFYRVRYQKRLRKFTIGKVREFSLEQARGVARDFRREARMGKDPANRMRTQANGN